MPGRLIFELNELYSPDGVLHLGNATYLLAVTPSNPLTHPHFYYVLFKIKDLVGKQPPTTKSVLQKAQWFVLPHHQKQLPLDTLANQEQPQ